MDIQTDRYNLIRPQLLWQMFSPTPPSGLGDAKIFGTTIPGAPKFPQIDEQALGATKPFPNPPPVAVLPVQDTLPIIRATSADRPLVVDGDGEGLVDVAATGLVDNGHAVFYSGSFANDPAALRARLGDDATLVVTDTNRKRARRWSTVRDNYGYTEQAGEKPLVQDPSDARLDVFPDASDDAYTVTEQRGVKSVQAWTGASARSTATRSPRGRSAPSRTSTASGSRSSWTTRSPPTTSTCSSR
jgi:arabinofuranan 3-O-arabinosyltransferase